MRLHSCSYYAHAVIYLTVFSFIRSTVNPDGCWAVTLSVTSFITSHNTPLVWSLAAANRWQHSLAGHQRQNSSVCTQGLPLWIPIANLMCASVFFFFFFFCLYQSCPEWIKYHYVLTGTFPALVICVVYLLTCWLRFIWLDVNVSLPQRAIKMEKKTVAGLSKRWLARAVPHAVTSFQ